MKRVHLGLFLCEASLIFTSACDDRRGSSEQLEMPRPSGSCSVKICSSSPYDRLLGGAAVFTF